MVRVDMSVLKGMDIVSIHSSVENLERIVNANERKNSQGLLVTGEPGMAAVDLRKYLPYDVSTPRIFARGRRPRRLRTSAEEQPSYALNSGIELQTEMEEEL